MTSIPVVRFGAVAMLLWAQSAVHAQEASALDGSAIEGEVWVPDAITDGTPPEPAPPPELPDFKVLESRTRQLDVVEAPPMPGLPPVAGTINVTVQKVEDPELPPLPEPVPSVEPTDPAVIAALQELAEKYRGTELLFISASVYDHSRTLLRVYPNGRAAEVAAWSNLDFNHFAGFSTFRFTRSDGTYTDFGLLMGLGNTDTEGLRKLLEKHGQEYVGPEIPELPDLSEAGPRYVVVEGEDSGELVLATLARVHALYAKEGPRLEAAYLQREQARKEREAYFRANPPKPKDVTINFWRTEKEGGNR